MEPSSPRRARRVPLSSVGAPVIVIRATKSNARWRRRRELLAQPPAEIARNGGHESNTTLFTRGTDSTHGGARAACA